jgi:thioredoxin-related protein
MTTARVVGRRQVLQGLALPLAVAAWPAVAAPDSVFEPSFGDFADELRQLAPRKKKALLLFFEMEACPFCHRLHRSILSQSSVRDMLRRDFQSLRVDIQGTASVTGFDGQPLSEKAFAKALKVQGTPTIVAYAPGGQELARLVGAPSTPEEFLLFGRYVTSGETAKLSFAQFKAERRAP